MATQAQMEANRSNAAKSTGPATDAGKSRSRRNALRHGITAQVSSLSEEDRAAYETFTAALVASLWPEGDMELQLAQSIADASWRLNRTHAVENNLFAVAMQDAAQALHDDAAPDADPALDFALAQARAYRDNAKSFDLLSLYEQRLNRSLHRDLDGLRKLQAERRAQRQKALEQAALLKQSNDLQALSATSSSVNGFVFSDHEIDLELLRRGRRPAPKTRAAAQNRAAQTPKSALGVAA